MRRHALRMASDILATIDFTGSAGSESWTGGSGSDSATGGGGNDTLKGMDGDDLLYGGSQRGSVAQLGLRPRLP